MPALNRIVEWRTRRAKEWKILDWTLGMAFAAFLVFDGKGISEHLLQHLLIGAALGLVLGFLFSRNQNAKGRTK
jgi:inner membrane protein involved in colicin E2 resistance